MLGVGWTEEGLRGSGAEGLREVRVGKDRLEHHVIGGLRGAS